MLNICGMAIKDKFKQWIGEKENERDRQLEVIRNLDIAVTEAAFNALKNSTHTSGK